jgi:hypothetical protein
MRMRILSSLVALALGVATAFLVACGGDGRIPASDASRVNNALNDVAANFRAGKCQAAEQAVARARGALLNLPSSVDSGLRDRLRAGVANLSQRVPATCGQAQTQTQTQETQTEKTQSTESTQTTTTETSTTDTSTTDTGTQPTESTGTTTGGTATGTTATTDTGTGGATPGGTASP